MITFLPVASFSGSAKILDKKRLFKQVIEAKQMLDQDSHERIRNHPATLSWKGHEIALTAYYNEMLKESLRRGINTKMTYLGDLMEEDVIDLLPWWYGDENYHKSHMARLISKDRDYYLNDTNVRCDWYNGGQYWYPMKDGTHNFYRQHDKLKLYKDYLRLSDLEVGSRYTIEYHHSFKISSMEVKSIHGKNLKYRVTKSDYITESISDDGSLIINSSGKKFRVIE